MTTSIHCLEYLVSTFTRHTILLGIVKYYWGQAAFILDQSHSLGTLQVHLDSLAKDGLGDVTLVADYIV